MSKRSGSPIGTATRSYDSDNHIVQQTLPADFSASLPIGIGATCTGSTNQQTKTYAWSADGRLATFATTTYYPGQTPSQSTSTEGAHWDGDDLLYVSYGSSIMMLYVEKLGVVMWSPSNATTGASQMMVYDRDQSGTAVTNHWAGAFAKLDFDNIHASQGRCPGLKPNSGDPNNSCSPSGDGTAPSYGGPSDTAAADNNMTWGNTIPLDASRDDGYSDGTLSFQGVRAYDPNMNQWTTPDAYSGRVNDPMSQHPYMWNDNNPVQYSDPSGYIVTFAGSEADQKREKADYDKVKAAAQGDPAAKAVFDKLEGPGFTVMISENGNGNNGFDAASNTINWDPHAAEKIGIAGAFSQSPAVTLTHEADHAQEANRDPTTYIHDVGTRDKQYGNAEERRVVTGSETSFAKQLGEGVRTDHNSYGTCHVESVTGTC